MAAPSQPAATSQTKPNNDGGVTSVPVLPPRKVTYVFKITSSRLSLPVAVAVDGKVLPAYAKKALRVSGANGRVEVTVLQGQKVSLYLNSDASPQWRTQPVYAVAAGERDAVVTITEKSGKHSDSDAPTQQRSSDAKAEAAKPADTYTAPLTGDIWMKVSHKYTEAEVESRLPSGTSEAVKTAVKSIYKGLSGATLTISEPAAANLPSRTLTVKFDDSDNPKNNITSYTLLGEGLPRVHPGGYAALFTAALENGITAMTVSSCWRPMLGSIAHRAGLGLDVSILGGTILNRQELRRAFSGTNPSRTGNHNDRDNVSDAEVTAFGEYEAAISDEKAAVTAVKEAQKELAAAKKAQDAAKIEEAQAKYKAASTTAVEKADARTTKEEAWNRERNLGEPNHTKQFRASLLKCSCVGQLFDPWFMDTNARDQVAPEPNMQRGDSGSNERIHSNHLHVTIDDSTIL